MINSKTILAFVGMPGAGKTEAAKYLNKKNIPFVRFGDLTEKLIKEEGLEVNTENERIFREKIRQEFGMGAYAEKSKPLIDEMLSKHDVIAIDGLYSWEEYVYLKKYFPFLKLILIYAEPHIRYQRLAKRPVRPVEIEKAYSRDVNELEKLNKGGPIAIADFCIINNEDDFSNLYKEIDQLLTRLNLN